MDAFGHLNNIVYFRYFETARIHYFERCGFMATYEEDRIGAILHSTSCRFRRPLHFPGWRPWPKRWARPKAPVPDSVRRSILEMEPSLGSLTPPPT